MQPDRHQPLRWEPVKIERPWLNGPSDSADWRRETRPGRGDRRKDVPAAVAWADRAADIVLRALRAWRKQAKRSLAALFRRRGSLEFGFEPVVRPGTTRATRRFATSNLFYLMPLLAGGLGVVAAVQHFQESRLTRSPKALEAALSRASVAESRPTRVMRDFSVVDELPSRPLKRSEPLPAGETPRASFVRAAPPVQALGTAEPVAVETTPTDAAPADDPVETASAFAEEVEADAASPIPAPVARPEIETAKTSEQDATPADSDASATGGVDPKAGSGGPAVEKARRLLGQGDVYAARRLLRPGAWANDPTAIHLLAQTYDPKVLSRVNAQKRANPATARKLYARAKKLQAGR